MLIVYGHLTYDFCWLNWPQQSQEASVFIPLYYNALSHCQPVFCYLWVIEGKWIASKKYVHCFHLLIHSLIHYPSNTYSTYSVPSTLLGIWKGQWSNKHMYTDHRDSLLISHEWENSCSVYNYWAKESNVSQAKAEVWFKRIPFMSLIT